MSNDQHWAEIAADKLIAVSQPEQVLFTVASGMTPSGQMHIGHFREVMTTWLVKNALEDRGKKTRFILSWDDFDVFRKVPADMPNQEYLTEQLRKSISDVYISPMGQHYTNIHQTYADLHSSAFELSLAKMNIVPTYIHQSDKYKSGDYGKDILLALKNKDAIRAILNKYRKEPLPDEWTPLVGFCDQCGKDNIEIWHLDTGPSPEEGDQKFRKECFDCGHVSNNLFEDETNIKLPWRIDWSMRWAYEGVDFEPGGKDHSSDGGSYDTGKDIVKLFGGKAPQYLGYNFIKAKGQGGKLSSSAGNLITLDDALEVYEPEIIKWMFASYRPNAEFQISFDTDVIKLYGEYDKALALALKEDVTSKAATRQKLARKIFKLTKNSNESVLPSFKELSMTLQIYSGDIEKTAIWHEADIRSTMDYEILNDLDFHGRLRRRLQCVANWLEKYAPEELKYQIRETPTKQNLTEEVRLMLTKFCNHLVRVRDLDDKKIDLRTICEGTSLDLKEFSKIIYELIMGRENGPPIPTLIQTIYYLKWISLIEPSLDGRMIINSAGE